MYTQVFRFKKPLKYKGVLERVRNARDSQTQYRGAPPEHDEQWMSVYNCRGSHNSQLVIQV